MFFFPHALPPHGDYILEPAGCINKSHKLIYTFTGDYLKYLGAVYNYFQLIPFKINLKLPKQFYSSSEEEEEEMTT